MERLEEAKVRLKLESGSGLLSNEPINSDYKAVKAVQDVMQQLPNEAVVSINLDAKLKPINYTVVGIGNIRTSLAPVDNVMKSALLSNASSIILMHNHPSGDPTPSNDDCITTARFALAGKLLNVELNDHIIVGTGTNDYYSFKRSYADLIRNPEQYMQLDPQKMYLQENVSEEKKQYKYKSNTEKHRDYQKAVANDFLELLNGKTDEESLNWIKEWRFTEIMRNGFSNRAYEGVNVVRLRIKAMLKEYSDPRWFTYNNVGKAFKGAHVKKGERGTQVEYWEACRKDLPKDSKEQRFFTLPQMEKFIWEHSDVSKEDFVIYPKYITVFNGEQCEGVPKYEPKQHLEFDQAGLVTKIAKNMNVPITNSLSEQCYYSPADDSIHMPNPDMFVSEYSYNVSALHELGHASGAEQRLNREGITNTGIRHGGEKYAYEELVAEMTSAMTGVNLAGKDDNMDDFLKDHMKNHLAYVKDWKKAISKDSNYLVKAIKEAEEATDFLELNGGLMTLEEFNQKHRDKQMVESSIEDQPKYLSKNYLNLADTSCTEIADEIRNENEVSKNMSM